MFANDENERRGLYRICPNDRTVKFEYADTRDDLSKGLAGRRHGARRGFYSSQP